MERPYILHMITPEANVSPFDVNMAYDAGYDAVAHYTGVALKAVAGLTQDAIFSRSPSDAARTGIFLGGRDVTMALDMFDAAKGAMFPPFEISLFPDPSGSFTTAAAMVACTEKLLKSQFGETLEGKKVMIYGGKGIVGSISGVIAAHAGAEAVLVGYDGLENVKKRADDYRARFDVELTPTDGSTEDLKLELLKQADVVFSAARAGLQVLSKEQMKQAPQVKVVADVNAVPPAGIEGVELKDNGTKLESGALSIGPLASGDVKFKVQHGLLKEMVEADKPVYQDFEKAADLARKIVGIA